MIKLSNMKYAIIVSHLLVFVLFVFGSKNLFAQEAITKDKTSFTDYVDPFIGTIATKETEKLGSSFAAANVHPGAVVPWGMVSASPHNTMDSSSNETDVTFGAVALGYIYGNKYIYGFGQLHLSGVGCHDWGNIVIMPTTGKVSADFKTNKSTYADEVAKTGYYKVKLTDQNVMAELSATTRTTIHQYTFQQKTDSANVIVDLYHSLTAARDAHILVKSNNEIEGWSYNGGFCGNETSQKVYFVLESNKPAKSLGTYNDYKVFKDIKEQKGKHAGAYLTFAADAKEKILIKIGISFVSIENARLNLNMEQPGWDFDKVVGNARQSWNKELSRIKVEGGTNDERKMFYTALYHALIHPSVFNDVNGQYRSFIKKEVKTLPKGRTQYTVYSLWDTYRNLHPLLTLVYPDKQIEMVRTMVDQYKEGGYLPIWELAGNETSAMVGDPALPVIADTYLKGLKDFDINLAYEGMIKSSTQIENNPVRSGIKEYLQYGYIPFDTNPPGVWGPLATTLEYGYSDWCVAQIANVLGKKDDYALFTKRSKAYTHFYDDSSSFLRPKNKNGSWMTPFNPDLLYGSQSGDWLSGGPGYVEGNAWQYNFFVPHDIQGLRKLMGKEKFLDKLQSSFEKGNRFVLFNEPDMAYPYLFDYIPGEGWRTQKEVRAALAYNFSTKPDGLPGNDDCGTLSAWYIFSAMGFYPACPGSNQYQIGSPIFDKVTIQLNKDYYKGVEFVLETAHNNKENVYIQSAMLNGKSFTGQAIEHANIVDGGRLVIDMGSIPKK